MTTLVKLVLSPFTSAVEVVGNLTMKVHVPYSDKTVTLQFSPNYVEYKENADNETAKVRQLAVTTSNDETSQFTFDFGDNRKHAVIAQGTSYQIELQAIGKTEMQGHGFPTFEFTVIEG